MQLIIKANRSCSSRLACSLCSGRISSLVFPVSFSYPSCSPLRNLTLHVQNLSPTFPAIGSACEHTRSTMSQISLARPWNKNRGWNWRWSNSLEKDSCSLNRSPSFWLPPQSRGSFLRRLLWTLLRLSWTFPFSLYGFHSRQRVCSCQTFSSSFGWSCWVMSHWYS